LIVFYIFSSLLCITGLIFSKSIINVYADLNDSQNIGCTNPPSSGCNLFQKKSVKLFSVSFTIAELAFSYYTFSLAWNFSLLFLDFFFLSFFLLIIVESCAFVFVLYLLYLQLFVVYSLCKRCLYLASISFIKFCTSFCMLYFNQQVFHVSEKKTSLLQPSLFFLFCLSLSVVSLLHFLNVRQRLELSGLREFHASCKSNFKLFIYFLRTGKKINTEILESDIIIGNYPNSINLLLVIKPFCNPCNTTLDMAFRLFNQYPDDIVLIVRFYNLNEDVTASSFASEIQEIIKLQHQGEKINAIKNRFYHIKKTIPFSVETENLSDIRAFPLQSKFSETIISSFPSVFICNYKLPDFFSIDEIHQFVPMLINHPIK
jgi:hypothetical protein